MVIWRKDFDLKQLNASSQNTLIEHLQIVYTNNTDGSLTATMPVSNITKQPFGILHGGASVVLAETLGSTAAYLCTEQGVNCVGLDINANHIKAVKQGYVTGVATPLHLGRNTQVWQINIFDQKDNLVCISRLTVAILHNV